MKKTLVYTLVVVVGLVLLVPYVAGKKLKEGYMSRIEAIPKQNGLTFENQSYDQGWFRSTAVTEVDMDLAALMNDPELADIPARFFVKSSFLHGPVLFTNSGVRFGLGYGRIDLSLPDSEKEGDLSDWLESAPVQIRSLINFDQSAQTDLEVSAYESDEGEDHVRFGGLSFSVKTDSEMTHFDGSLIMPPSSVLTEGFSFSMGESSGSMTYSGSSTYTLEGESVLNLKGITVVDEQFNVKIESLNINGGSSRNGDNMNYFQTFELDNVESTLPVTAGKWHFEMNQVPIAAIEIWADLVDELEQQSSESGSTELSEETQQKVEQLIAAVKPGVNMVHRVDLQALGGSHEAIMKLTYKGLENQNMMQMEDPMAQMKAIDGELLLQLEEASITNSQFGGLVSPYVQQGLLVPVEENLVLDAKLQNGELIVNGNLIPLEALLQSAMEQEPETSDPTASPITEEQPALAPN